MRSEVRVLPGPPGLARRDDFARQDGLSFGAIAQLGERVLCKHEVVGSIPSGSTKWVEVRDERSGVDKAPEAVRDIPMKEISLKTFGFAQGL